MKYLITGGCGFLGANISEAILRAGSNACANDCVSSGVKSGAADSCADEFVDFTGGGGRASHF